MHPKIKLYELSELSGKNNIKVPEFRAGDTIRVQSRIVDEKAERLQAFEGICIAYKRRGLNSSFTIRKVSYGEGVERVFALYSPRIASIEVISRGRVRRARLYYLRSRQGRAARITKRRPTAPRPQPAASATQDSATDAQQA